MKIVLVGPLPRPINGCSYANDVLLRSIEALGYSVSAVNTGVDQISGRQGSEFSWLKAMRFLRVYLSLPRVLAGNVAYLTPGQTFYGVLKYAPFILACILSRTPYVIHLHGNHLGRHYAGLTGLRRRVFRYLVSHAAAGIVLSESLRSNFDGLLSRERVFVTSNFAGDELFEIGSLAKSDTLIRVLYLSNLMREKGVLDLLDALVEMKERGVPFEARIAGEMEVGIEPDVNERLRQLGGNVQFLGAVSGQAKRDVLAWANVLVLPTYYAMEGQPICLLEGLAAGCIVVTTRHAGIPDVIDESNGHLVPIESPGAIAKALTAIALDLPSSIGRFSLHNARYAARRFTERDFVEGVLDVLRCAAGENCGVRESREGVQ